jgi:hypothetical protein
MRVSTQINSLKGDKTMPGQVKVTKQLLEEIKNCCHNGHGASVFSDGTVMQAISSNDVLARGDGQGGWDYRVAYVDDPEIDLEGLKYLLNG